MRLLASLFVAVAGFAFVPPAHAGTYVVESCSGASGSAAYVSSNDSPATLATTAVCPSTPNNSSSGITVQDVPRAGGTAAHAAASWTMRAPVGTLIRRLTVDRYAGRRADSWSAEVLAQGRDEALETCPFPAGEFVCTRGIRADNFAVYDNLTTPSVSFVVRCESGVGCSHGQTLPQAWITIRSSIAVIDDPEPPVVAPIAAALLGPGWHSGTERVEVAASDASGVGSVSLKAGGVTFGSQEQGCDYSRMRPCPPSMRTAFAVDTSKVPDGTYDLVATATDSARQSGTAAGVLRVDRSAPAAPSQLAIARNADGTYALSWTNPNQGTASPIVAARVQVCEATGCGETVIRDGHDINQIGSIALPAGERTIRVWLEDEAGHAEQNNAVALTVDPSTVEAPRVLETGPPVLLPTGLAPSPRLRVTKARRSGAILTLSGTIARGATAAIRADVSRGRNTASLAGARTKPKKGRWSLRVRLTTGLRRANAFYVSVVYSGQQSFRKTTLHRRLSKKAPRHGSTATEFSVESR